MAELSHDTRILILNDRFVDHLTFKEIAAKRQGVNAESARTLCRRTSERAGSTDINDLLKYVDSKYRSGRPMRVAPGSEASIRIRHAMALDHPYLSQEDAANLVLKRARNLDLPRQRQPLRPLKAQQVHNIAHSAKHYMHDPVKQKPITRKRCLYKIPLEKLDIPHRKRYCEWIQSLKPKDVELILCDETPIQFGGSGRYQHASGYAGDMAFANDKDPRFSRMQWAAVATDSRAKRRIVAWQPESSKQTSDLIKKLQEVQDTLDIEMRRQREAAVTPGTPEYSLLQQKNEEVRLHNLTIPQGVRPGRKQRFTPERLFKAEKLSRDSEKGGLDSVFYAFEILQKHLIPYYEEVQKLNPNKTIWIVEDNVGVHLKARRICAALIKEKQVKFANTPANSPDLNPIEHLHKDEKHLLFDFRVSVIGAGKDIQKTAVDKMEWVWVENDAFADKVTERCRISYLKGLAYRCSKANPPYSNRYRDSL